MTKIVFITGIFSVLNLIGESLFGQNFPDVVLVGIVQNAKIMTENKKQQYSSKSHVFYEKKFRIIAGVL